MQPGDSTCRIVFMGGGSTQFSPALISDFVRARALDGSEIILVDLDEGKLETAYRLGLRLIQAGGSGCRLRRTTDRSEALPGADFVILSVEVDRLARWEQDRRIPRELGIQQALGENGGPGGLAHALRQIPPIVEICKDVERLCPGALVLNLSNPMSRILQAVRDATEVAFVGLCHEIGGGNRYLAQLLEIPENRLQVVAAGLNHFTWYLKIRDAQTGEDLYPRVRDRAPARLRPDRLLVADLLRLTGLLCVTNDSHAGEYLAGGHLWRTAWDPKSQPENFFERYLEQLREADETIRAIVAGDLPAETLLAKPSGEALAEVITAVFRGEDARFDALNLPNDGFIENLPRSCIVEVPGRVSRGRVHGEAVGELPPLLAGWCRQQTAIHRLTARAALEGDRRVALEALLLDPVVPDRFTAERCLDALLEENRAYLRRFFDRANGGTHSGMSG